MILRAKKTIIFLFFFVLAFYALLNLISSQTVSPLFVGVSNDERSAAVTYLQKIRKLQIFDLELANFESTFGPSIVSDVFKNELKRQNLILDLKSRLTNTPKSRDLLYGLATLYQEDGQDSRYKYYLNLAREIDPEVK